MHQDIALALVRETIYNSLRVASQELAEHWPSLGACEAYFVLYYIVLCYVEYEPISEVSSGTS